MSGLPSTRSARLFPTRYIRRPETLESAPQHSVLLLKDALSEKRADVPTLCSAMTEHLIRDAGPIFARNQRVTPNKATAIRMAALSLAAEADWIESTHIGDLFRQMAAGITLLNSARPNNHQSMR